MVFVVHLVFPSLVLAIVLVVVEAIRGLRLYSSGVVVEVDSRVVQYDGVFLFRGKLSRLVGLRQVAGSRYVGRGVARSTVQDRGRGAFVVFF